MEETKTKTTTKKDEYEFCKVCKLNHNKGRRHNFFPNHIKSLSSFLSRFQSKLADIRFFLKNPTLLRPEHASRNRLWCVICDSDIHEVATSFVCANAINHLASVAHLKNLKGFLWKYGGGMDRVDSFRISEADLAKWEKKCKSLKSEAAGEGSRGPIIGPLNDIHNDLKSEYIDSFDQNNIQSLNSSFLSGVAPLQNYTNERYQVSHSELSRVAELGPLLQGDSSYMCVSTHQNTKSWGSNDVTGYYGCDYDYDYRIILISPCLYSVSGCIDSQHSITSNIRDCSTDGFLINGVMSKVYRDERTSNGGSSSHGSENLSRISPRVCEDATGNVHSGAPPPWLNASEENQLDGRLKSGLGLKSGKSSRLNPKRVGAAWADRRKIELAMEKRGEIVSNNFDANWLPNFGRVWQSGSRKESMKEFEVESQKSPKVESHSEMPMQLQPYLSKRMRRDGNE